MDPGGNNTLRRGKDSGLPLPVALLMKLFFPPPSRGASLLFEAAVDGRGVPPGAYVTNGAPKELPFAEQGPKVLAKVSAIYQREFATDARA